MAALTRTKRSEVIKNALAVYHWFLRQAVTGARDVARNPSGEEVTLETPELARLEGQGVLMRPKIRTAVRLLALAPLQEIVHGTLTRLDARQGRRSAALRQYAELTAATALYRGMEMTSWLARADAALASVG